MKIWLLRHAKTEKSALSGKDFDRKLAPQGVDQMKALQAFLSQISPPTLVLCSTAKRARQTAALIQTPTEIEFLDELYLASLSEIKSIIERYSSIDGIMIIGHNDGLSEFASWLLGDYFHLRTGELIIIDCQNLKSNELISQIGSIIFQFRGK